MEHNNHLSEKAIRRFLGENCKVQIKVLDKTDSTNSEAKRDIVSGMEENGIIVAEEQTAGRGRRGKSFYSPKESGLYFTAVLHPEAGLEDATGMTAAAAVAVVEIIRAETKKDPKIKWVNDVYIDGKKVCGILTEAVADAESNRVKALIVGIGINITTEEFPEEIRGIADSIGKSDRNELTAKLFLRLQHYSGQLASRTFMDDYRKYSMVLGETVTFIRNGTEYTAKAEEITDSGALSVITDGGEKILLNGGEISIRIPKA